MRLKQARKRRKLYIFDLDETLWDGETLYDDAKDILKTIRAQGHFIYIATFNTRGPDVLRQLGILEYFHGGSFGRGVSKYQMVMECLDHVQTYHGYNPLEVEFYDDQMDNIADVHKRTGARVRSVFIRNGLRWRHLNSDEPLVIRYPNGQVEFTTGYYPHM